MANNPSSAIAPIEFNYSTLKIRVVLDDNGNPLFCAKDVCNLLEYANISDAVKNHCDPEGIAKRDTLTQGGEQEMLFVSEGNLYRLIIKSNKPQSKPFEAWVCDEVLPQIRRQGFYGKPLAIADQLKLEAALLKALSALNNSKCAFSTQIHIATVQTLCQQLNRPMPNLALIGQDPKQVQLPGFAVEGGV